jgi:hypothetical protein
VDTLGAAAEGLNWLSVIEVVLFGLLRGLEAIAEKQGLAFSPQDDSEVERQLGCGADGERKRC